MDRHYYLTQIKNILNEANHELNDNDLHYLIHRIDHLIFDIKEGKNIF